MTNPRKRRICTESEWLGWRAENVNASEISALTGDHNRITHYALWLLKTEQLEPAPLSPEADRGHRMEQIALDKALEDYPDWMVSSRQVYYDDQEWRIGGTPDAIIEVEAKPHKKHICLEIKTMIESIYRQNWSISPPQHVLDQIRVNMWLTGCDAGVIACLIITYSGAFRMAYFDVEQDMDRILNLKDLVLQFWASVEDGKFPEPDYARDLEIIRKTPPTGESVDLTSDIEAIELRDTYRSWQIAAKIADEKLREIKGKMLFKMNGARTATFNGETIAISNHSKSGNMSFRFTDSGGLFNLKNIRNETS